jgi:hypothetical protein
MTGMCETPSETVICITHLRQWLGVAYQHVAKHNEPNVVRRYGKSDVALVPMREWRFFK